MTKTIVVVPWRPGDVHRERAWDFVYPRVRQLGFPIRVGDVPGEWSLARTVNFLAEGSWDKLIVHTADVLVPVAQVFEALQSETDFTLAFDRTARLNRTGTWRVYQGRHYGHDGVRWYRKPERGDRIPVGGVHVTSRWLWDEVGGYDERFVGWGGEDTAYARACGTLGTVGRVRGELVSLWHPHVPKAERYADASRLLTERYRAAAGDVAEMRRLLGEERVVV